MIGLSNLSKPMVKKSEYYFGKEEMKTTTIS